jgi:phosphoribosylanthranilate isomerase
VKICGITNWADARRAIEGGADFLGFNFVATSPRYVTPAKARLMVEKLPSSVSAVGVFQNEKEAKMLEIARSVGLDQLQLHGDETPAMVARLRRRLGVIKALRVKKPFRAAQVAAYKRATAILLDGYSRKARGGTGKTFDWQVARRAKRHGRIFLAGGLTPENVGEAIRTARPYAVDVCSGVESRPGKKDPRRMRSLLQAVKGGTVGIGVGRKSPLARTGREKRPRQRGSRFAADSYVRARVPNP